MTLTAECSECVEPAEVALCAKCAGKAELGNRIMEWCATAIALGRITREDAKALELCASELG